jgi:hypothetical protein
MLVLSRPALPDTELLAARPATREIRIIDCENRDGEVTTATRFRPLRSWSPGGRMTNIGMFACQIPAHQARLQQAPPRRRTLDTAHSKRLELSQKKPQP